MLYSPHVMPSIVVGVVNAVVPPGHAATPVVHGTMNRTKGFNGAVHAGPWRRNASIPHKCKNCVCPCDPMRNGACGGSQATHKPPALSSTGQAMGARNGDEPLDAVDMVQQLTEALATQMARVIDLFREWDDDENGLVSKLEFRRALPMLGLKVDRLVAEQLFDSFDEDRSGEISYGELNSKLHASLMAKAGIELDDALKAGAMGKIETESKNKFALRTGPAENVSAALGSGTQIITGEGAPPILEQLTEALQKNLTRVIDLFREWDDDGNGQVSKAEFRLALPMLGLQGMDRSMADDLFDSFDRDGSGTVEYCEISRSLRPKPSFLPKVRSAPQILVGGGSEDYKVALAAQQAAKKRLVKIQKELLRAASTSALKQAKEEKAKVGLATRRTTDVMVGADLAKLLAATTPASEAEVRALAIVFHKTMQSMFPGPAEQRLWYKLFLFMDEDKSGRISYHELSKMVRSYLAIGKADLPEPKLRALWRALDEDASGFISAGEFGRFMKKGDDKLETSTSRQRLIAKRLVENAAYRSQLDARVGRDVSSRLADVTAASDEDVTALAEQMTTSMASLYPGQARAWVKLFKYIDTDLSGRIDFREFTKMCRDRLMLAPATLSEAQLQGVWKSVDSDSSGYVSLGEFGRFMKKGAKLLTRQATDRGIEDETYRRGRLLKEKQEARARQAEFETDHKHHVAARNVSAQTRQLEMECARLEAALRRKAIRGVDWRASLPSVSGLATEGDASAGASLGSPARQSVRPMLPPLRIAAGVDF